MNVDVEIGTEAKQFPEKEYINGILVAVEDIHDLHLNQLMLNIIMYVRPKSN